MRVINIVITLTMMRVMIIIIIRHVVMIMLIKIINHSASHSFGEQFSKKKWLKEMAGQRLAIQYNDDDYNFPRIKTTWKTYFA